MDYVKAFLIGGLIRALVQILMEKTKMMPGRIMVLLVCTGAVLGAVGAYEPFRKSRAQEPLSRCLASVTFSGKASKRPWMQTAS